MGKNSTKDNNIPAGATFPTAHLATVNNVEEFPAHCVIEHFQKDEVQLALSKATQKAGVSFHLIPDLIDDLVLTIHAKVIDHPDFHDNYEGGSEASWQKIKQYDVINNTFMQHHGDQIDFDYYYWNDPRPDQAVLPALDDDDLALAQQWGNGELHAELALYQAHCQALNTGQMVAAYDDKTGEYSYHRDANVLIKNLVRENNQSQLKTL